MRWWDTEHFRDTDKEPQPLDPEFKPNLWLTLARQRHAIRKASNVRIQKCFILLELTDATVEDAQMFYFYFQKVQNLS